ncbi:MAG TPA: valine--tRNA ligase [Xanthobacteraceae bacterium]|nr:valine--tRNA ligase [Xanthobacteraceae bacterium]
MLEKHYQPNEIEDRIYKAWLDAGAFDSGRPERKDAEPYCIVIPPPNVTGSLHMGHALNNTLQDILCRFERMRGKDVLWQVGTDHAGIATQMVVERQLMEKQQHRRELGREKFLERVWEWKAESGGTIIKQLKRLGASCDWRRERFTMDDGLSKAVLEVFVTLHKEGLIYRDKRLVNWDPKLLTAISDLEVQQVEVKGHLWHLRYPLEGKTFNPEDPSTFIVVATTRPETMLGDTGVAVHPDDERYKHLVGKNVILPLVGRKIPIVADEYSDPEKGSGAVKITPAHDFNDFEVGKRHNLAQINVLSEDARIAVDANEAFLAGTGGPDMPAVLDLHGKDRFAARKIIVEMFEARGMLEKIEPNVHMVPHGDRSGVVLEPRLTDQWYVDAKKLAVDALAAVKNGKTVFVPKNWEKTYFDWLENIQPWCVSRQLWWGHQIPAWYAPDGEIFVERSEDEAKAAAKKHFGRDVELKRDEDVLDTWFSSALWPFSTLGWPDKTKELERYYPTQVLVTGFDIIFFWVARMMMMGLHFMQKERPAAPLEKVIPFHTVYIHALVRDERGAKMSKSKGNVIDPLHLIDEYGADALRFTLAAMAAQGRDIKLATSRVEGYRNFATKLWNAARFAEMNGAQRVAFDPKSAKDTLNRWILGEAAAAAKEVTAAIEAYKFNDAANAVYRFVWSVFCDWYVELAKPVLTGADGAAKDETRATAAFVLDQILKLLHPFMPFLTEELWGLTGQVGPKRENLLALSSWPQLEGLENPQAEAEIGWLVDLISAVRSVRSEMNVPAAQQVPLVLVASKETRERAARWGDALKRLARLSEITFADAPPQGSVQLLVRGEVAAMPLKGVVDLAAEQARLKKELAKVDADIERVDKKLANPKFVENADEEVVEGEREKREEAMSRRAKFLEALERLKGAA